MTTTNIEALVATWAAIAEEFNFPPDFDGTPTPEAYKANETIQSAIRDHIIANKEQRLFGLLHLLGYASVQLEQTLWPEEYERQRKKIENALREADELESEGLPHEKVMRNLQENLDKVKQVQMSFRKIFGED